MQPVGPYRFTEALGVCQVGTAWWAIDGQDRLVTVAVLEGAAAADPPWREAFANAVNAMAQAPGGQRYVNADLAAANPWVAYPSEEGLGAQRLFQTLGMELQPLESQAEVLIPATGTVSVPPQPVSGAPLSVSGPPNPTSGPPHVPWAMHAAVIPQQQGPETAMPSPTPATESTDVPPADPFSAPVRRIQPSTPPPRRSGLRVGIAAVVLLVAVVGTGVVIWANPGDEPTRPRTSRPAGGFATAFPAASPVNPGLKPWVQAPPYSPEERALAIASPSLVFIEASFTGIVRDARSNIPLSASPVTFKRRCSGFVVNPDGVVLTNGQCVRPADDPARERALYTLGRILIDQKKLAPGGLDAYVRSKMPATRFTGAEPTSSFTSQVSGQLNVARGDLAASPAIPGEVVRVLEPDAGNLAVVKLAQAKLPAVELGAPAAPGPGALLLVLGYQTTDAAFRGARFTLASKSVQVTGAGTQGAVAVGRINDDIGIYSHGGVAIDTNGKVVGMLDSDRAADGLANRALVPVSAATGLLTEAGVSNSLSDTDKLYRSGLDAYFGGRTSTAVSHLGAVADTSPANLLAQAYRQSAVDREKLEGEEPNRSGLPAVLFAGLGGAVVVGLLALLLRRRTR